MLIAMTYNFWYIMVIVLGLATSDFFFSFWQDRDYIAKIKENLESGKLFKENLLNK